MNNKPAKKFDRTVDIPKAFARAFYLSGPEPLSTADFTRFMKLDSTRTYRIRTQVNMNTDTVQKAAEFFGMPMSEFIALGE